MLYRNKKTNELYSIIMLNVVNATNGSDNQLMVLYSPYPKNGEVFIREQSEFNEKFERAMMDTQKWEDKKEKCPARAEDYIPGVYLCKVQKKLGNGLYETCTTEEDCPIYYWLSEELNMRLNYAINEMIDNFKEQICKTLPTTNKVKK
jgi:hypothetical protein